MAAPGSTFPWLLLTPSEDGGQAVIPAQTAHLSSWDGRSPRASGCLWGLSILNTRPLAAKADITPASTWRAGGQDCGV